MQELVKVSPSLLPGGEPLAIVDELGVPGAGWVDLVGVGADGQIVIVECKLKANPEIRREVVGQVLSYAGGIWRMSYDQFSQAFAQRAGATLYQAVKDATDTALDESQLASAVAANLESGTFRLVVAVDEITAELRTIIEFLNSHTVPNLQVQALELDYSKDGDVELLTPNVYGLESMSSTKKKSSASGTKWNESTFDAEIDARCSPEQAAFIRRLIEHGKTGHHLFYGSGASPGMSAHYSIGDAVASLWAVSLWDNDPRVALNIGTVAGKVSPERALAWVEELRQKQALVSGLSVVTPSDLNRYPTFSVDLFSEPVADALIASIEALRS